MKKSKALIFTVTVISVLYYVLGFAYSSAKICVYSGAVARSPRPAAITPPATTFSVLFDAQYVEQMRMKELETASHATWTQTTWTGPGAEHVELFSALLGSEEGGLYVDVGANEGVLLTLAAMMGHPTVGIEAISQNYVKLLNIVRDNHFQRNVRVVHAAASDVSGKVVAFKENINAASRQRNGQQVSPGETLDDQILQYTTTVILDDLIDADITLLKLDVEGTEFLALKGSKRIFSQRTVRYVHFEFSPSNMMSLSGSRSPLDLLSFLHDHGYSIYIEDCSHDISDAAISELPAQCAKQSDAEYMFKFRDRDRAAIERFKLHNENFGVFLETMLKHSVNGSVLVNLLAVLH